MCWSTSYASATGPRTSRAVGNDKLGREALVQLDALGVDSSFIATLDGQTTGTACVDLDADGVPAFGIVRPAAYDALELSPADAARIVRSDPGALVFGTLAQQTAGMRASTRLVASACAGAIRFYDVNLREGGWDEGLVLELAELASVIKLNEQEALTIGSFVGVPSVGHGGIVWRVGDSARATWRCHNRRWVWGEPAPGWHLRQGARS